MTVLKKETAPRYVRSAGIVSYLLASPRTSAAKHLTTSLVELQPGGEQRMHRHNPEQVYYILEGSGLMAVGTEAFRVGAGDCVFIPSGVSHGLKDDGNALLRYFSAASCAFEPKELEHFWPLPSETDAKEPRGKVEIARESPDSADAIALITELEAHLEPLYPPESRHGYSVEKLIAQSVAFFVLRENSVPAGCGGIQLFGKEYGELKRMYVRPRFRGLGFGKMLLDHLSDYAQTQGVSLLRLETGIHQAAAIRLYERMGFQHIPPFGDYGAAPLSLFYEKRIL